MPSIFYAVIILFYTAISKTRNGPDLGFDCNVPNVENMCHSDATCLQQRTTNSCLCNDGFAGDGINCEDIDECSQPTMLCHTFSDCTNLVGSYTCNCRQGFTGDGKTCKDVNECSAPLTKCHAFAYCTNTIGSYTCKCRHGFTGDGIFCEDIDECNKPIRPCRAFSKCTNTIGSYTCDCMPGFQGNGTVICRDINECLSPLFHNCSSSISCRNTLGGFTCTDEKSQEISSFLFSKTHLKITIGSLLGGGTLIFLLIIIFRRCSIAKLREKRDVVESKKISLASQSQLQLSNAIGRIKSRISVYENEETANNLYYET